jgi:type I restriction enzyme, S subunit
MNGQDLKNSILQLAVQGKLVDQREEEGNAKELIEQIKDEKKRLIKEKKIRKEDPLTELKENEAPFDIPDSWEWVKLGEVVSVYGGKRIPAGRSLTDEDTGYKYIRVADMKNGSVMLDNIKFIPVDIYEKIKNYTISKDDVYITVAGTIGQVGLIPEELDNANLTENADKLVMYSNYKEYIYHILSSNFIQYQIKEHTTKVGQPKLAIKRIKELIIPIPPLEEQKRIVAKIEEIMPYVEKYDQAYTEVEALNKKFPDDMQKSILQYAIKGKLAEQREEEGTAEELYQQIQEEKKKMIKEGKIKKTKALPEIAEDEMPFDIPESWKWVRLEDICEYIQRGKSPKYSDVKKYPVVAQKCNQWSGFSLEKAKFIDPYTISSYKEERFLVDGDLMWNSTGLGTLGRVAIYEEDKNPYEIAVADSHVTVIRPLKQYISYKYLYYYIANPSVQNVIEEQSSGSTKQIELATNTVKNYIVPLPPQDEQKRIVEKIEELLPYSKQLVK